MSDKSIFVTGAAKGIGRATALLFAQEGWFIGLSDLNLNYLNELADKIGNPNCSLHIADVRLCVSLHYKRSFLS